MLFSRSGALTCSLLLVLPVASGQQSPSPQQAARVEPEVLLAKTVARIRFQIAGELEPYSGTGFIVAVPDTRLPADKQFSYLVTNRHVAEATFKDTSGQCKKHQITAMDVTLNLKTPVNGDTIGTAPLGDSPSWFFPADPGVDLAVLPLSSELDKYDYATISPPAFVTADVSQKLGLTLGDKLLTPGFFRLYPGKHHFQPILRQGILAMIPDDAMPATLCDAPAKVYLADMHIIAGNSGSPVFLGLRGSLGGLVQPSDGGVPHVLLGVVSGYMYEDTDLTLRVATDYEGILHANSGVAMVVPAEQLKELLFSPALQSLRDRSVAAFNRH